MQKNHPESAQTAQRVGVDEKLINFRPSPNFKNMKKFFRQRMMPPDGVENTEVPKVNPIVDPKPPAIHPPLPRDPPPPDNPEPLLIPKVEMEDPPFIYEEQILTDPIIPQENIKTDESEDRKPKTVCKDFIRGSCTRPNCRFTHENSAPHRFGVYKFCKKFQNAVCDLDFCRYVHADTFQEAHYYRTGILPPNALAHIKTNAPKPPPPPTVFQPNQGHLRDPMLHPSCSMAMNMTPGPSMMSTHLEQQMPLITCIPHASVDPMMSHVKAISEEAFSLNNFNWMTNRVSTMQHIKDECTNCDYIKYRYQNTKQVTEERTKSLEAIQQRIDDVDHKTRMMNLVFLLLLRTQAPQPNASQMSMEGRPQENLPQFQSPQMPPYY